MRVFLCRRVSIDVGGMIIDDSENGGRRIRDDGISYRYHFLGALILGDAACSLDFQVKFLVISVIRSCTSTAVSTSCAIRCCFICIGVI